jgi:AAA+ ATPase superfamily predicted ATPase
MYNFKEELASLRSAIKKHEPLITIAGLRRTGKTSMLLTATTNISDPVIIVDLRTLLELPYGSKKELIQEIERAFNIHYSRQLGIGKKLLNWLKKVRGVQISDRGLSLAWGGKEPVDLAELFDEMNSWAVKEKKHVTIAFDEAQELRKVAGVDSRKLLAHLYDYCRNITIILTGSEVGLLYDFLGEEKEETPLFGRHIVRVSLEPLPPERARDFLTRGFKQAKIKVSDPSILDSATERLDGIIGWLNLFGVASVEKSKPSDESIEYVARIGKSISRKEFNNFLKDKEVARSRYEEIMRFLASNPLSTWSLIKRSIETAEGRKISDTRFADLLSKLVDSSFVIKYPEATYRVADPLLAEVFTGRKKKRNS